MENYMIDETPVQLDQIEIWQHALEEGRSLFTEATQLQAAAKQAQLLRHWTAAAEKFRQARSLDRALTLGGTPLARLVSPRIHKMYEEVTR